MIMWIAAVVLVAATIAAGYRQGAIRVLFSLAGLIAGALLALRLGPMLAPIFPLI